jgi:hypothetical protein
VSEPRESPETVLEAVQLLEREGYTASIDVRTDGMVHCATCSHSHPVGEALVDRVFRFEGASDPDDEAIVLAVRCPRCGAKGIIVSGFGPSADPRVLAHLQLLDERFRAQ